ncbi:hypothetical protein FKO01_06525 [Mesorhizobium sp. B2-3-3]|nr:hypothetical protein FKO01_06525 [Mesorhizobium sp. B2-3-3]
MSGWDAVGNDFPNMPIRGITAEECQSACDRDFKCLAVTYNTKYQASFMKGDASILVKSEDSVMAAKKVVESNLHYSNLVFAKNTEVSGNPYRSGQLRYPEAFCNARTKVPVRDSIFAARKCPARYSLASRSRETIRLSPAELKVSGTKER